MGNSNDDKKSNGHDKSKIKKQESGLPREPHEIRPPQKTIQSEEHFPIEKCPKKEMQWPEDSNC